MPARDDQQQTHGSTVVGDRFSDPPLVRIIARNLYDYLRRTKPDDWATFVSDPAVMKRWARLLRRAPQRELWTALEEDGSILLLECRLPFFDGARALLKRGVDPQTRVTMRIEGSPHDSFVPMALGKAASLTVEERTYSSVTIAPWKEMKRFPRSVPRGVPSEAIGLRGTPTYQIELDGQETGDRGTVAALLTSKASFPNPKHLCELP